MIQKLLFWRLFHSFQVCQGCSQHCRIILRAHESQPWDYYIMFIFHTILPFFVQFPVVCIPPAPYSQIDLERWGFLFWLSIWSTQVTLSPHPLHELCPSFSPRSPTSHSLLDSSTFVLFTHAARPITCNFASHSFVFNFSALSSHNVIILWGTHILIQLFPFIL